MGFKVIAKVDRGCVLGCDFILDFKGGGEEALSPAPAVGADAQALADWAVLFNVTMKLLAEGQSISDHVLLMKSYLDQLAILNYAFPDKVSISFILNLLSSKFQAFMKNYNMQSMEKTIMMAIQDGRVQKYIPQGKAKGKGKSKGKGPQNSYPTKPKKPQPYKKERLKKDGQCHHCKEEGHWKRNCPVYLAELMKKKKKSGGQIVVSTSLGIYTIELFAFPKNSWVYDTGFGTHNYNTKQGLRGAKKLKRGSLYLYIGNGLRAEVEAIGSFDLVLSNGLIIVLDNCHYAPSITRGVVLVSRLVDKGFTQCFMDFRLSVSMNNMLYFNAINVNGIYEIDMRDSTLPIFDQCISCISGKMTRKPFSHKTEKVKDVPGLIHTDVCGPLIHVSKKGASYFITFTDDYSHCGYVYLLKHKHEVFETFKVFKSEVENQLGKTIKVIRSDRGGEYISQEFKDYLKAYGIVQQLTPPYTPQHNGVSERRNHTLLNMVRSMISLATLPLSFWDYALEFVARILNMVPTKKVDKTPYELWHEKVPNLSNLKVWGCEAQVERQTPDKLQQRSVKCIFVGYPKETMGYYFYYPPENKIVVERYADFLEKDFILQKESGRIVELNDECNTPKLGRSGILGPGQTLILAEESRLILIEKQNDSISNEKKVNISPINYHEMNKFIEFGKHFVPQKKLSTEQAFWLSLSNLISEQLVVPHTPVQIEVPKELPKNDWEILFQPLFDEYFNPPPSVASPVPAVVAPEPADLIGTPSSTSIDQDAPSPVIPFGVEK
nr:retrotransposon protein, putative, Ty1-copia subclass [Tanacetum cinerariifolium]